MYKNILIPLDGSKTAESVLPYARACAGKLGANVELLAVADVIDLARTVSAADGLYLDQILEDETHRLSDYLAQVAKSFTGVTVQPRLETGNAADAIIDTAVADKGTLVMVATHGRSGVRRWVLGGVTETVVRHSGDPVLIVRAGT